MSEDSLILFAPRTKLELLGIGLSFFIGTLCFYLWLNGVKLPVQESGEDVIWLIGSIFLVFGVLMLCCSRPRNRRLEINQNGFAICSYKSKSAFCWSEVDELRLQSLLGREMVVGSLKNPSRYFRIVRKLYGHDFCIPIDFGKSPEELLLVLKKWQGRYALSC